MRFGRKSTGRVTAIGSLEMEKSADSCIAGDDIVALAE